MKITMIGCGTMGSGLAQRLSSEHQLFLYDRHPEKVEALVAEGCGKACPSLPKALAQSEAVILAVKPQNFKDAAQLLSGHLKPKQLLISLLTGIQLSALKQRFPSQYVLRMMPNLALLCGEGLIGLSSIEPPKGKIDAMIQQICQPLGVIFWLPEAKMDPFTSLAASGPAFVFAMIEAMVDAGIGMGFKSEDALTLVCQMIKGSIALLETTEKHPAELKWQVTSPAGTTIAGLKKLEEHSVRAGIINTFYAAQERAKQLST